MLNFYNIFLYRHNVSVEALKISSFTNFYGTLLIHQTFKIFQKWTFIRALPSHCDTRGKYYKIERYINNQRIYLSVILNKIISNTIFSFTVGSPVQIHVFKLKHLQVLSSLWWKSFWETFSNGLKGYVLFDCCVHCSDILCDKVRFLFQMLGHEVARMEIDFGK